MAIANKYMDKKHMKKSCKDCSQDRRSAFAAIGFGEIVIVAFSTGLTERALRERTVFKARAEAE